MSVHAARGDGSDAPSAAAIDAALRPRWILFAIIVAIVWFGGLDHRKLIKPDEGRYAEIPREMVASGDWLTPRLNDLKYFEKPPLQYWTTAIAYEAFGPSEWTSRLWTALTGFLGLCAVGVAGTRLYDRRTGFFSAVALTGSLAYVLLAHFNTLDMGLAFFMNVTLFATALARNATAPSAADAHCGSSGSGTSNGRGWMLLAWASLALAVLSKGPVAAVLSGGALVLYLIVSRDWALLRMLAPIRGLAVFVVIAAPWFIAVSRANPEFAHFFFIHEHVERFLTTEHRREGPLWYFVPVLAIGLLPWLTIAVRALITAWRAPPRGTFAPERLLLAWCLVIFLFFSASGSKLPSYVLPMFPALALLIGRELARIDPAALRRHVGFILCVAALACTAAALVPRFLDANANADAIAAFRNGALVSLLMWLVGAVIAWFALARGRVTTAVIATGMGALVAWSGLLLSHESLGRSMSTFDIAQSIRANAKPDTTIYSVGIFEHTLDFYLGRTVTVTAFRDELDFGLTQEPAKGVPTLGEFVQRWQRDATPLAIMDKSIFDTLTTAGVPMRVIADDGRRIVVAKREGSAPGASTTPASASDATEPASTQHP